MRVDPVRWQQTESIFHAAAALPEARRAAFVADACGDDRELFELVSSLLVQSDDVATFMERPAMEIAAAQLARSSETACREREFGAYQLTGLIGAGGMGVVYRARDPRLGRDVAIKLLPASFVADHNRLERFEREARLLAALNHAHIGAIYDLEEADGVKGLVLELVEGETLAERIRRAPIPLAEALIVGRQIADALQAAHAKGIIHRDLKPANVKVTADGIVKVLDFGLAKVWSRDRAALVLANAETLTAAGPLDVAMLGTPGYMSPEQARGRPLDARTDVWAFGCVMFEMLAGTPAFEADSVLETISRVLQREPAYERLPRAVPGHVRAVLQGCLQKDIARRTAEMSLVRSELERAIATRASRFRLGKRAMAALALTTLTLLLGATLGPRWISSFGHGDAITAFADRDWLLVADLDNQDGNPLFDKTLNTALSVSLGQSSYVNVLPAIRVQEALRRMTRAPTVPIDVATAREIALREDVRLVLAPTLSRVGETYLLSARLVDPATGNEAGAFSVRAQGDDNVLNAVDELVARVRRGLGEARASIERQRKPLQKVTTSSLEALKLYSAGREKFVRESNPAEARVLYENAIRLDPTFTAAKAQLGMLLFEFFDQSAGRALLTEAAQRAESLADAEKYSVLAFHATVVEHNPAGAIDYWKTLLTLHPDRSEVHNNLGRTYHQMERLDEAMAEYRESMRLNPWFLPTYYSLNTIYLYDRGMFTDAVAVSRQAIERNGRIYWSYDHLGWALLGVGELEGARAAFAKALELNPKFTLALFRLGCTLRLQGKYEEARRAVERVIAINPAEFDAYYSAGVASALMGDTAGARVRFQRFLAAAEQELRRKPLDGGLRFDYALALARVGETDRAEREAQRASQMLRSERSVFRSVYYTFAPSTVIEKPVSNGPDASFDRARFLAVRGKYDEAITALEDAITKGYRNYVWIRAQDDLHVLGDDPRFKQLYSRRPKPSVP